MTMTAYQEIYLSKAQDIMGDAFDYAVNACNINGEDFVKLFIGSSICKRMENGEANYLAGKSGIEIVRECVYETMGKEVAATPQENFARSAEYWCGWAVAYYQWYSARKYADIFKVVSFNDLLCMYPTLHEADISKFCDIIDKKMQEHFKETNLKRLRVAYGCSQKRLSELSGVSLRSIQMYEQRKKDINKASVTAIYSLAKALGCTIEDLLEPNINLDEG